MEIEYKETKEFTKEELEHLFLSVHWDSGKYPDKLVRAMKNSTHVISAWYGDKLIGLIRGLDDGETVGFVHYLLVDPEYQGYHIGGELLQKLLDKYKNLLHVKVMPSDPKTEPFYMKYGFKKYSNYSAMEISNL